MSSSMTSGASTMSVPYSGPPMLPGVNTLFLTGYTPTPVDRFGRPVKDLSKVALGGELSVTWNHEKSPMKVISTLKKLHKDLYIIAIEQDKASVDYKKVKLPKSKSVLFIVGNEVKGVPKKIVNVSDVIAEIPMRGKKESLNVGVSFGIALFTLLKV
jgi:tRNA G18 (ribose-2'-O)-methylase SpoU